MKTLLITALLAPLSLQSATYWKNDGRSLPESFSSKSTNEGTVKRSYLKTTTIEKHEQAPSSASESELNKGGVSAEDMNTSPNPAPAHDKDLVEGTTLSTDQDLDEVPEEFQAQEEDALDYSTTPQKKAKSLE